VSDPLLALQEQADAAIKEMSAIRDVMPLYATVYGYGEAITMLTTIVGQLALALSHDEQIVLAEALSAVAVVARTADEVLSATRSKDGMWSPD
jgi:hypothetical protein